MAERTAVKKPLFRISGDSLPFRYLTRYLYLSATFLKIGSTAFGGFMALISVVRDQVVNNDRRINEKELMNGISLAAILPGPMAVNVVSFVGYRISGISGSLVSIFSVIFPSFVLVLILSIVYFASGDIVVVTNFFKGVTPAVAAIVLTVSLDLYKQHIHFSSQKIITVSSALALFLIGGVAATLTVLFISGTTGYILYRDKIQAAKEKVIFNARMLLKLSAPFVMAVVILLLVLQFSAQLGGSYTGRLVNLAAVFGSLSLTLFGGGYVMVPVMHELFVENLSWLTGREFSDGIALGQITPGPILITATFIGYKIAGFAGAVVSTVAIFLPPALLMVRATRFMDRFSHSAVIKAIFQGLRPAVIGLVFSAAMLIIQGMVHEWSSYVILIFGLVAILRFKISLLILIPLSGLIGLFFNYLERII